MRRSEHVAQQQQAQLASDSYSPSIADSTSGTTLLDSASSSRPPTDFERHDNAAVYHRKQNEQDYHSDDGEEDEEDDRLLQRPRVAPPGAHTDVLPVDEEERATAAHALQAGIHGAADADASTTGDKNKKAGPISWSSLPHKDQLAILTLARLSEPLTQTSLQTYMFYQLRSFSPSAPDSTISYQAGLMQAAFTAAQFCTAILWGRLADSERMGRKRVILVGLFGTAVGAVGFGFSSSFGVAMFWRALGGALNGNIGVMRTMISEIIREKKFQSRAFLLLPMTFNIGVIIGPVLGGLLSDPVGSYPSLFGPDSTFGGKQGVTWMTTFPYALPNLVSAVFLLFSAIVLLLGLEESLEALRGKPDIGLRTGRFLTRTIFRFKPSHDYHPLAAPNGMPDLANAYANEDIELQPHPKERPAHPKRKLPFKRIWTANVLCVMLAHGMLSCHVGTFNNLWFVFLSTPRYVPTTPINSDTPNNATDPNASLQLPENYVPHAPWTFTGGLALPPASIGSALAILGVIGITLQLLLYPPLSHRLGTARSYRLSALLFPVAYTLVPFLAIIPTWTPAPRPASGPYFWVALVSVLAIQVLARTFALPATAILVNNASPHPSVLGTVHGVGQSVSSAMRTFGPVFGGWVYGKGLGRGVVGLVWWGMAGWAVLGAGAGWLVRDGDGHEIWLEGEREEEVEMRLEEEEAEMRRKGAG